MFVSTKELNTEAPVVINLDRVCYVERITDEGLAWYFDPLAKECKFTEDNPKLWTFLNTICEDVTKLKSTKSTKSKKES